ncbi:hypothetical protein [Nocardia inohanensis]|uniref:hypothetical protein n=1 Tax=Nocardia inohanensis TaxID=209246 RepID=UPI00082B0DE6|nr:hypothetical protein [Nocardia inohanensis]
MATPLVLPSVVGFIRPGTAGSDRERDAADIHAVARQLGYIVAAIVYDIPGRYLSFGRIMSAAWSADAAAVIVPNDRYLHANEISDLLAIGEVIVIESAKRHTASGSKVQVTDLWDSQPITASTPD